MKLRYSWPAALIIYLEVRRHALLSIMVDASGSEFVKAKKNLAFNLCITCQK